MSASKSRRHDGNDFVNRWDFRCRRNDDRVDAAVTVGGRLFQALVPAAVKDRSPSVDLRVAGTTNGDLTMLTLLDLSAAFDTVDHETLIERLGVSFGLRGTVLGWFQSYLDGRTQCVRSGSSTYGTCGVPQESVRGAILFLLYAAGLTRLIESHDLHPHGYADDTQIYGSCPESGVHQL